MHSRKISDNRDKQGSLFASEPQLPPGFLYQDDFLSLAEERDLLAAIASIELKTFQMHGVTAKRRIAQFGWHYALEQRHLTAAEAIPEALLPVRSRLAEAAGVHPEELSEALVTQYQPGAGIGWHHDAPAFGIVTAVSLMGRCRMRFRQGRVGAWTTRDIELEPRSMYVIAGPARSQWQHGMPPATELRYSITFRTVRI